MHTNTNHGFVNAPGGAAVRSGGSTSTVAGTVRRAFAAFAAYRRAVRDYDHLLDLPEHLLRDVGLTREEVATMRAGVRVHQFWS